MKKIFVSPVLRVEASLAGLTLQTASAGCGTACEPTPFAPTFTETTTTTTTTTTTSTTGGKNAR